MAKNTAHACITHIVLVCMSTILTHLIGMLDKTISPQTHLLPLHDDI